MPCALRISTASCTRRMASGRSSGRMPLPQCCPDQGSARNSPYSTPRPPQRSISRLSSSVTTNRPAPSRVSAFHPNRRWLSCPTFSVKLMAPIRASIDCTVMSQPFLHILTSYIRTRSAVGTAMHGIARAAVRGGPGWVSLPVDVLERGVRHRGVVPGRMGMLVPDQRGDAERGKTRRILRHVGGDDGGTLSRAMRPHP